MESRINNGSLNSKTEEKITFHKFPQDPIKREQCVDRNMQLENFVVKTYSPLWFGHFESNDYEESPVLLESL